VADDQPTYPLLLYSHGRCGARWNNTGQIEELASHGYVVAAIDHPSAASGVRFPDGRVVEFDRRLLPPWTGRPQAGPGADFLNQVVPFLVEDVLFVLRSIDAVQDDPSEVLAGRLELGRVGILGPSLGGIVAAEACLRERRLGATLIMDAYVPRDVVSVGLARPVMWLTRDAATMRQEGWDEAEIADTHASIRAAFDGLPGDGYIVLVPGMYHVDFGDGRLLSPLVAERGISGPIDERRARDIVGAYSVAFFDRHLKGAPAPLLDEVPASDLSLERRPTSVPSPVHV
jgi:predicted dienelactone hydrolase